VTSKLTMAGYAPFSVTDALKPGEPLLKWLVAVSLFSWARSEKKNGWWASALIGRKRVFGSLLWKMERLKNTAATAIIAKTYIEQALAWLTKEQVVDKVVVETTRVDTQRMSVAITLLRDGEAVAIRFSDLWEALRVR